MRDFTVMKRRWATLADDTLSDAAYEQRWERRHLYVSVTLDGWLEGAFRLDPAGGQAFLQRLDALAPPDPATAPDGPRTLAQRRADALIELAASSHGSPSGAAQANLKVVIDLPALAHEDSDDVADSAAARCDLDGIGPVPRSTLGHLACDATVTRLLTAGSVVVDMGRAVRVVTAAQRRALAVRDRRCRFPSCRRTAAWCDAHHIVPWLHGGETNLDNLVRLCRRHHTLIHNTRWTIDPTPHGTLSFTHPTRGP